MARAHSIWLVEYNDGYDSQWPVGTFTVKHELVTWLGKQASLDNLLVYKMKDGIPTAEYPGGGVDVDLDELLGR
jgi:hypothetical protein